MVLEIIENTLRDGKQLLLGINPKDKSLCFAGIYNHTGIIRENYIISNDLYAALVLLAAIIVAKPHLSRRRKRGIKSTVRKLHQWIIKNEIHYHVFHNRTCSEEIFEAHLLVEVPTLEDNHISIKADSIISLMEKTLAIELLVQPTPR